MSKPRSGAPPAPSVPPGATTPSDRVGRPLVLRGIAGSPGVAIAPCVIVGPQRSAFTRRHIKSHEVDDELARFADAVDRARESLRVVSERVREGKAGAETAILDAYAAMLGDETIADSVERHVRIDRQNVEWAVSRTIEDMAGRLADASDPYLMERQHDVTFVGERLQRALAGTSDDAALPHLDRPTIVLAHDLSPADTAAMVKEPVVGFVTEVGTRTSHTAIMARALEIPAVVGVDDVLSVAAPGETIIIDGFRGEVVIGPTPAMLADAEARALRHAAFARQLRGDKHRQAKTADGTVVHMLANVELPAEALLAIDHGAEGIGLYRTEFLYVDRTDPPNEEEQFQLYRAVLEACAPRPVTLRTFDIGGDKFVSTFQLPDEMNPALGLRAVRLALSRPDVFLEQLRAMVRASVFGTLRIMIPMVSSLRELAEVRELFHQALREIDDRGLPRADDIPLGVMIEVPSAAIMADAFAREAAFMSLGTNDLVQYALAIDRTNRALASLASPFDPSVLRLIAMVVAAATKRDRPLSVCGAMASDPLPALLLVGMGLRDLSMEAAAIPEVKEALRRVKLAELEAVARAALLEESAEGVQRVVTDALGAKLHDLIAHDS